MTSLPCQHCGRALWIRIETDGQGGTLETGRALCPCPDARWRRGQCVDCGRVVSNPVPRPFTHGMKRCPEHAERADLRQRRERSRRYKNRNRKERRAYDRAYQRRRRRNPVVKARALRERRRSYAESRRIRGKPYRRALPPHIRQLRDRLAYRLSDDEGWSHPEIAEVLGLNTKYTWVVVKRQRVFRQKQAERRAA